MRILTGIVTVLVFSCVWGCNNSAELEKVGGLTEEAKPVVYEISNGRIEIKPRLKYEIIISLHVLKFAEDHHELFIPWAQQMRKDLSEKTLYEATVLIENSHQWQLCSLVQEYDGADTIESIADFINADASDSIKEWAKMNGQSAVKELKLTPNKFAKWYADFLKRYYEEGFKKQWLSEHKELVYKDAEEMAKELKSLSISPIDFMEDFTGRRFKGSTKIILYPSSFSRPQHAYGFSEGGHKVAVYKVGGGTKGVIGCVFHELLHPLIRGWWEAERMEKPISKLAKEDMFKASWEKKGKGSYPYPNKWLDELVVHSVANYMLYKAGFISKEWAYKISSYCDYEQALFKAIFDRYDSFENIDDFIFYAINHIKMEGKDSKTKFEYIKND
jgi:hypothetical protein